MKLGTLVCDDEGQEDRGGNRSDLVGWRSECGCGYESRGRQQERKPAKQVRAGDVFVTLPSDSTTESEDEARTQSRSQGSLHQPTDHQSTSEHLTSNVGKEMPHTRHQTQCEPRTTPESRHQVNSPHTPSECVAWLRSTASRHSPIRIRVGHHRPIPHLSIIKLHPGLDPLRGGHVEEDGSLVAKAQARGSARGVSAACGVRQWDEHRPCPGSQ
jgi:hypothetical protein